ncbi:Uncharacterised protein (plasmid) [Tsukamurella tyrosinosolvens]|uniref:SCO6045-like C-terminal domain-containing protein n=1 Tax=Tsukamurella tyrosinosolvens TaxID=57704 RepID=A0A1H4THA5_TSUTY|nr:hypothetical protein [Tsukamurella tyrosinosolvens]AUN42998.1 hypothetical protein ASU32_11660 [Tsukamurella tyrosinosolvens]KXO93194.1 hypothetical protein AXK58_15175 [Tsukamurella tyrosinosolvens]MEC4613340.1 hypothetical protein [Tsukamurella tyrosinosolvens]RDB48118.1 hypothetical protein DVB87_09735 [Tsukamurella tyrosinosolvens]SEC55747.1 hypothetical protein SAMN04489793_2593 [Tsukamurella tyrosinosolvens]
MSLRERQEALVRALVADGPVPEGFDPDEVAAAGAVCRHKRDAHAAHAVPAHRRRWWRARRG